MNAPGEKMRNVPNSAFIRHAGTRRVAVVSAAVLVLAASGAVAWPVIKSAASPQMVHAPAAGSAPGAGEAQVFRVSAFVAATETFSTPRPHAPALGSAPGVDVQMSRAPDAPTANRMRPDPTMEQGRAAQTDSDFAPPPLVAVRTSVTPRPRPARSVDSAISAADIALQLPQLNRTATAHGLPPSTAMSEVRLRGGPEGFPRRWSVGEFR